MRDRLDIIEEMNKTELKNEERLKKLLDELIFVIGERIRLKRKYQPAIASAVIQDILEKIAVIPNDIKQLLWIKQLVIEYGIKEDILIKELYKIKERNRKRMERIKKFASK